MAMLNKWQTERLLTHRDKLVESLDPTGELFDKMQSYRLISKQQVAKIQLPLHDKFEQARQLIDHMLRRTSEEYTTFMKCLIEVNQAGVVRQFLEDMDHPMCTEVPRPATPGTPIVVSDDGGTADKTRVEGSLLDGQPQ